MKVVASPGMQCPLENNPREYISDDPKKAVTVADTTYYQRLLNDGSLVVVADKAAAKGGAEQ